MYFLRFFRMYIADQIAFFKRLLPPPKGGGELAFDDDMLDPIQGRLHRLLGQLEDIQQIIYYGLQEIVCQSQIRQIRGMFKYLDSWSDCHFCTMAAV